MAAPPPNNHPRTKIGKNHDLLGLASIDVTGSSVEKLEYDGGVGLRLAREQGHGLTRS